MTDKTPHPMTEIQNIRLEDFEKLVYSRKHEEAGQMMLDYLRKLRSGAQYIGYPLNDSMSTYLHTRFAAAIFTLLSDEGFEVTPEGFARLASEHGTVDLLFRASAFGTSDHMLPVIADADAATGSLQFSNPARLIKFLMTYSLCSKFGLRFEETFKQSPQATFGLYAAMLAHLVVLTPQAQTRKEELLNHSKIFKDVMLSDATLPMLADAYMYTSYGHGPQRHEFKALAHSLLARMMGAHGAELPDEAELAARRARLQDPAYRPTMVIPLDWFTSLHAMYRCWVPVIRQLRKRYRLVAFSQATAVDEESKLEFDEWVEVPAANIVLAQLVKQINAYRPDAIYYPSVGMTLWWITTASLRLAPVQLMTLGHPSSTFSPAMDYVLGDTGTFTDPALFSETMVELPEGSLFRFAMRPDAEFPPLRAKEPAPEVVRIAVPAMVCKLNATFLAALKQIKDNSPVPLEFHFFPNMVGLLLHQTARELRDWLPGSYIYERTSYNEYLGHLNRCDLHLCTFPFGGTNSNVDSMKLGIPMVCLEGKEPYERFDAIMLRKVGLPEWVIAKDEEEYAKVALRLIADHATRRQLSDLLVKCPLDEVFFQPCQDEAFGEAVAHLLANHETIQAVGDKWVRL